MVERCVSWVAGVGVMRAGIGMVCGMGRIIVCVSMCPYVFVYIHFDIHIYLVKCFNYKAAVASIV